MTITTNVRKLKRHDNMNFKNPENKSRMVKTLFITFKGRVAIRAILLSEMYISDEAKVLTFQNHSYLSYKSLPVCVAPHQSVHFQPLKASHFIQNSTDKCPKMVHTVVFLYNINYL